MISIFFLNSVTKLVNLTYFIFYFFYFISSQFCHSTCGSNTSMILFSSTGTWFTVGIRRRSLWAAAALILWSEVWPCGWDPLDAQRTNSHSIKTSTGAFKESIGWLNLSWLEDLSVSHVTLSHRSIFHSLDSQQYLQVSKRRKLVK